MSLVRGRGAALTSASMQTGRDLEGKVILLTGGTEGIGKAAAHELARRGATLVVVGRNPQKTTSTVEVLRKEGDNPNVTSLLGDLSKMADVRQVARQFRDAQGRLDVLINNAGAMFWEFHQSADGFELTFALNHLGYFQLTVELLDLLRSTPGARVVSTSSDAHKLGRIDLKTLPSGGGKGGFRTYANSKLANILFTRELAKRLEGSTAVATCFHPGFVRTGFALNNEGMVKTATGGLARLFGRTPQKGAQTLLWLATAPEAASSEHNGGYFHDMRRASTLPAAKDDALAAGLWTLSEELVARTRG